MNRLPVFALGLLLVGIFLSDTAWSKGAITKIVIKSDRMSKPLEITDREILNRFTIWVGPGVGGWDTRNSMATSVTPNFIVDWASPLPDDPRTAKERRADPHVYLVTFFIDGREAPRNTYQVLYEVDNSVPRGYVYIPAHPTDDFGQWNTFQISRGVEGRWFYSTKEWDRVARPLMDKE